MRVRILRQFSIADITYRTGEVVSIDPKLVDSYLAAGYVMKDKSLDRASETKAKGRQS